MSIHLKAVVICCLLSISIASNAQVQHKAKTEQKTARKVKYLYQANGGFIAFFNDGRYYTRAGEYTKKELSTNFKGYEPVGKYGKYKVESTGLLIDGDLIPFNDIDGKLDYEWIIIDFKQASSL